MLERRRLLVQRGARVGKLWHAAALGIMPRVEELLAATPAPSADDITEAFWQACHGGQRRTAERLSAGGADLDGTPGYSDQTPAEIAAALDTQRENLVTWLHDGNQATPELAVNAAIDTSKPPRPADDPPPPCRRARASWTRRPLAPRDRGGGAGPGSFTSSSGNARIQATTGRLHSLLADGNRHER